MRLDGFHFGLLVDTVENIITYFEDELRVFPIVSKSSKQMIKGCLIKENIENTVLLDFAKLINSSEISEITKGHASLYKVESTLQRRKTGPTVTYLAFTLDEPYAAILKDVKEVLTLPKNLMHPPGMHDEMLGVLNLRGTMVPIIDPRKRYGIDLAANIEGLKVVVFPSKGGDVGLVVSSIDSILHINEANANIFDSITKDHESRISDEIISGFEMTTEEKSFLVLDLQRIGVGYFDTSEEIKPPEDSTEKHTKRAA